MKHFLAFFALAVMSSSVTTGGKSNDMRQMQVACGELSSYDQLAACFQNLHKATDALLNAEYLELLDYLPTKHRENLVSAQNAWVAFRDTDCRFAEPRSEDSSVASAGAAACIADRTIARLEQLESYNAPHNKGCNVCPW